jgi:vitamin-K-epoxide reductase (warfarin-sensitive)
LGILSLRRAYGVMLAGALAGLAFSLYLAHIENHVLGVWCIYCAISLGTISLITLLLVIAVLLQTLRKRAA